MSSRVAMAVGLAGAWCSAVLWAVLLTLVQPATEPAKPWVGAVAENNTYWVRDLRFTAIVVATAAFVLAMRGNRRVSTVAVGGALAWFGVDIALDRLDVAGPAAAVPVGALACALLGAAVFLARRTAGATAGGPLLLAAMITAALVPIAGIQQSPTDGEAALTPSALVLGLLATLVALGCLRAAVPAAPAGLVALAAVAVLGLVLLRVLTGPGLFVLWLALGAALPGGVALLTGRGGGWGWRPALALATVLAVAFPAVLTVALFVGPLLSPAAPLTALAGNAPVNGADTDMLETLVGLVAGSLAGAALIVALIVAAPRPQP